MLEYLEKLAEDRDWPKVMEYAEQLLLRPENKPWDLMVIYTRLLQARFRTDEFYGAQVAGELALKMARELEAWDYFGVAAHWLGVSYSRLRQPEAALAAFYEYLAHLPRYKSAQQSHLVVLANIGTLHQEAERFVEAISVLERAVELAESWNDHRSAHGIRLNLINAILRSDDLGKIPRLLVKCSYYLRHNPNVPNYTRSLLTYLYYRMEYAVATNRFQRAVLVARHGLQLAKLPEAVEPVYNCLRLLAQIYERQGDLQAAIRHGVKARTVAIEARRFDLEYKITDYLYGLLTSHPDLVEHIDNDREERED